MPKHPTTLTPSSTMSDAGEMPPSTNPRTGVTCTHPDTWIDDSYPTVVEGCEHCGDERPRYDLEPATTFADRELDRSEADEAWQRAGRPDPRRWPA